MGKVRIQYFLTRLLIVAFIVSVCAPYAPASRVKASNLASVEIALYDATHQMQLYDGTVELVSLTGEVFPLTEYYAYVEDPPLFVGTVPFGTYTVKVSSPNYDPVVEENVIIQEIYYSNSIDMILADGTGEVIRDPALRMFIKNKLYGDPYSSTAVTKEALQGSPGLTSINYFYGPDNWYNYGIVTSLDGLQYATNLTELDLRWHYVSSLTPISGLPSLKTVTMSYNPISTLTPLSTLPLLQTIEIENARVASIPILPSTVTSMYMEGNQISDVANVAALTALQYADFKNNQINDITPFSSLLGLKRLELSRNLITMVPKLSSAMDVLYLDHNQITDVAGLAQSTPLTEYSTIDLANNLLTDEDLQYISHRGEIYSLDLSGNKITSLSGLTANPMNIGDLNISRNEISDLSPISGFTGLYSVHASHNRITDFSAVASIVGLTELDLSYNEIDTLPTAFAAGSHLGTLNLKANLLTETSGLALLDSLQYLNDLILAENQIKNLSFLNQMTPTFSFRTLDLSGNGLESIAGIDKMTNIMWLFMNHVDVDLSPLGTLKTAGGFTGYAPRVDLSGSNILDPDGTISDTITWLQSQGVTVNYIVPANLDYTASISSAALAAAGTPLVASTLVQMGPEVYSPYDHYRSIIVTKNGMPVTGADVSGTVPSTGEVLSFRNGRALIGHELVDTELLVGVPLDVQLTFASSGNYEVRFDLDFADGNSSGAYSGYTRTVASDAVVVNVPLSAGSALDMASKGDIIWFGGYEWILVDPIERQLLLRTPYIEHSGMYPLTEFPWITGFYGSGTLTDPRFQYDSTVTDSLAKMLNTTFLQSLDVGDHEDQWIEPTAVQVPYLYQHSDGTIVNAASPAPYTTAAEKVLLLTHAEYESLRSDGTLDQADPVTGWSHRWFLMNPITGDGYTTQDIAFVQDMNELVYFYPSDQGVRPTIRLQDNVIISGGSGVMGSPYNVALSSIADYPMTAVLTGNAPGTAAELSIAFMPNRSMAAGEMIEIHLPGFDISQMGIEPNGITVDVGKGPIPAIVSAGTSILYVTLPEDAPFGSTLVIDFASVANIVNPEGSGEYPVTVMLDGAACTASVYVEVPAVPDLASLVPSVGSLYPAFSPSVTSYTLNVASTANGVSFTPTAATVTSSVYANGTVVAPGASTAVFAIPEAGSTTVTFDVYTVSGLTKTYNVTVEHLSGATDLQSIALSTAGTVVQANDTATAYNLLISETIAQSLMTSHVPTGASVTVTGAVYRQEGSLLYVDITADTASFGVSVTAEDGTAKSFAFSVVRLSKEASIVTLLVNGVDVTSIIGADPNLTYSAQMDQTATKVTIAAEVVSYGALTINGVKHESGAPYEAQFNSAGTITLDVTAISPDGLHTKVYRLNFTRAESQIGTQPVLKNAYVGNSVTEVTLLFDQPLDGNKHDLLNARVSLTGTNGSVVGFSTAPDKTKVTLYLSAGSSAVTWSETASITLAANSVFALEGGKGNALTTNFSVKTPAAKQAFAQSIASDGVTVKVQDLIKFIQSSGADTNGDGQLDESDVVYLLDLLPSKMFQAQQ